MKEKKNDNRVSVRELAEALRVSTDTVRRAYRKGEIPAIRVKTALRFDLREVHTCMQQNAVARFGTRSSSAPAALPAACWTTSPRLVKRGRNF